MPREYLKRKKNSLKSKKKVLKTKKQFKMPIVGWNPFYFDVRGSL